MTTLWDTTGSAVVKELAAQRRTGGAVLSGVALTLVVVPQALGLCLEDAQRATEPTGRVRQPLGAEEQQQEDQDDHDLPALEVGHVLSSAAVTTRSYVPGPRVTCEPGPPARRGARGRRAGR